MPAPEETSSVSSTVLGAEPQLLTANLLASVDFYTTKLSLTLNFSYGDPPFYAQVGRDAGRLNLRLIPKLANARVVQKGEADVLSATLIFDDAKPLFLEGQAAGVDFAQSLRTEPWGARTSIVRDPDGNLLCFAGEGESSIHIDLGGDG